MNIRVAYDKLIAAGVEKWVMPGACTVMSKVCWSRPGGSMSRTNSGGTTLMPTCRRRHARRC